ncbi:MAG: hypothetical protein ACD_73C00801G0003 [uncultured bacterium]|nr:MAG: hypothetical protein ACD_73C00801G0003 [uncultured bacterium]
MSQFGYKAFHEEIKKVFGQRVDRVTVNTGMTCPNIDGTKAKGGCTFCADASYEGLTLYRKPADIREQIINGMNYARTRYPSRKYFAYFQNGTNTYEKPETLKKYYEAALAMEGIVGLFVATRPDCLTPPIIDLLDEINRRTYLWVELGNPSHKDDVNRRLNRAHTVRDFVVSSTALADRGIKVCAHVMFGLPGEELKETKAKAAFFNDTPIEGIKIHNMVVFKDTVLEKQYLAGHYQPQSLQEYTDQCVTFLEYLRPNIMIMRLNAHGPRRLTVAPDWSVNKLATLNSIHAELKRRQTCQGSAL